MITDDMTAALYSMTLSDQAYWEVIITTGEQTKKELNYLGAPKKLRQLEVGIEKLANTKRWIN